MIRTLAAIISGQHKTEQGHLPSTSCDKQRFTSCSPLQLGAERNLSACGSSSATSHHWVKTELDLRAWPLTAAGPAQVHPSQLSLFEPHTPSWCSFLISPAWSCPGACAWPAPGSCVFITLPLRLSSCLPLLEEVPACPPHVVFSPLGTISAATACGCGTICCCLSLLPGLEGEGEG